MSKEHETVETFDLDGKVTGLHFDASYATVDVEVQTDSIYEPRVEMTLKLPRDKALRIAEAQGDPANLRLVVKTKLEIVIEKIE